MSKTPAFFHKSVCGAQNNVHKFLSDHDFVRMKLLTYSIKCDVRNKWRPRSNIWTRRRTLKHWCSNFSMFSGVTTIQGHLIDLIFITDAVVRNAVTQHSTDLRSGSSPSRVSLKCCCMVIKDSLFLKNYSTTKTFHCTITRQTGYSGSLADSQRRSLTFPPHFYHAVEIRLLFTPHPLCIILWQVV